MKHNLLRSALFGMVILSLALTACQPKPAATPTASGPIHLVIWATGSDDEGKALQAAAALFNQKNPNITIEVQPVSWNDANAKMLAAIASGTGPDMITGGLSWGVQFGKQGGMVDLKASYPDIYNEIASLAVPQVLKSVTSPGGEVYGVQWDLTAMLMYYRKDLIPNPPATWAELTAEIEKQQAAGRKGFMMQWGNLQWLQFFNFLHAAGGSLYDDGCTQANVNNAAGLTALKFYADLYNKYKAPTDGWPDMEGGLDSGDYPLAISGSWVAGSLDAAKPTLAGKWGVTTLPKGPAGKGTAFLGGRIIGIMSVSKNPAAAAKFIRFIYTPEAAAAISQAATALNFFYLPPSVQFVDNMAFSEEFKTLVKAALTDAAGPPNCIGWEETQGSTVDPQLQEVIVNGADPQKALDTMAEAMNAALNE